MGAVRSLLAVGLLALSACASNHAQAPRSRKLTLADFQGYDSVATRGWIAKGDTMTKNGNAADLITKDQFANFELDFDWRISARGNSGLFYRGTKEYDHIYWSATEYQLEDNIGASDNKSADRWSGANYALYAVTGGQVPTADRWNHTRILANGAHIEHWLNGVKVVEYEMWSPEWKAIVARSKFNAFPNYAMAKKGYLGIQGDHPGTLSLANIRIKELP
jgi:hypothetical protein